MDRVLYGARRRACPFASSRVRFNCCSLVSHASHRFFIVVLELNQFTFTFRKQPHIIKAHPLIEIPYLSVLVLQLHLKEVEFIFIDLNLGKITLHLS